MVIEHLKNVPVCFFYASTRDTNTNDMWLDITFYKKSSHGTIVLRFDILGYITKFLSWPSAKSYRIMTMVVANNHKNPHIVR